MPSPDSLTDLIAALTDVLADGAPRDEEQLLVDLAAAGADLGPDPEEALDEVLDCTDLGLVLPLGDGRWVSLPAFLGGRTFTHRLSEAEVAGGYMELSPDLQPLSLLTEEATYQQFVDGRPVQEVLSFLDHHVLEDRDIDPNEVGEIVWLLEPDTLSELAVAAGDLVGVTVRPTGFELTAIPESTAPAEQALGGRLRATLEQFPTGRRLVQIDELVWQTCAEEPDLFLTPAPPLLDAFEECGLLWDGDHVAASASDFSRRHADQQRDRISRTYHLGSEEAIAVVVLSSVYEQFASVLDYARSAHDAGEDLDELFDDPADEGPADTRPAALERRITSQQPEIVREMLGRLDSPSVAEALGAETVGSGREGAAAMGLFAETLEPQAPRRARANIRWLRGRALERMGQVLEAEEAYEQALSMDEDCLLATFDLARYASDRGNAERGLSLLRRAGAPDDDHMVELLERFRPVERKDIGRNDRCWCGSGRKYKVCHRNRETLSLEERAAWLYQKAGTYVSDGPWRMDVLELAGIRSSHWDSADALWLGVSDPLVADTLLFEGGAFQAFLDERGLLLPEDELLLAQQWLLAERSIYEIESVSPGRGFTTRDLRTGHRLDVREGTASRSLKAGTLICTRLVPAGETVQAFGGIEPVALHARDELIALLDDEPDASEIVAFLSRRFGPPTLQNTEGDPLVFCEASVVTSDGERLLAHLEDTYEEVEGGHRWHQTVTSKGLERVQATFALDGDTLVVEANSERRMDGVLSDLMSALPGLTVIQQARQPVAELGEAAPHTAGSGELDPADPEIAALLQQVARQYEDSWLDESIPALAGITPREAAADPTRRGDLIKLLDSFPPADPQVPGMMDPERLRAALGL